MDHKKISLNPDELKKLQALLKQEEEIVDAMSDADVLAAEKALEARIRKLPQFQQGPKEPEIDLDARWKKLEKQLNSGSAETENEKNNIVSFARPKKKAAPWATMGILAAAALALLVVYPALRQEPMVPGDLSQMQTKGTDGQLSYSAFCDVSVRGSDSSPVEEAGAGMGYVVNANSSFNISVSCDKAGFIQVWSKSAPAVEVRDSKAEQNVRGFVMEEGKVSEFSLSGNAAMTLEITLTDKEVKSGPNLFELEAQPAKIGDANVLWADSLTFREKQ